MRDESGYSLIELLAAIVILTVAIIPMVTMLDTGLRTSTTSGNYDRARALANTKLEEVKSLRYAEAESTYPPGTSVPCNAGGLTCRVETRYTKINFSGASGTFGSGTASDGMMRVTVTVSWDGKSYATTGLVVR